MSVRVAFASRSSRVGMALCVVALLALATAPLWGGRDDLQLLSQMYAYVALASLWNLLAGYAGLVSVGQQAYVGLGAYLLFAFAILAGMSPLSAIPLAGIIAAVVAVPVAGLVFRLRGHYFAIGTWIVAEVFRLLASQVSVLGGGSGTSLPASVVIAIASTRQMRDFVVYWISLASSPSKPWDGSVAALPQSSVDRHMPATLFHDSWFVVVHTPEMFAQYLSRLHAWFTIGARRQSKCL